MKNKSMINKNYCLLLITDKYCMSSYTHAHMYVYICTISKVAIIVTLVDIVVTLITQIGKQGKKG